MRPWGGPYFAVSLEWWIMNEWRNCLVFDSFVNFVAYILRRLAKQHNKSAHKIAKWIFIHIYLLLLHTSSSHSLSLSLNKSDFLYETYVVLKGSFLLTIMYMFRCEVHFAFDRKMHQVLHCILKKAISTFRHNSKVSLFNQNSTFCNNASFLLCRTLKLDPWPRMAALFSLKALWCCKSNTSWFHFHHVCGEHLPTPNDLAVSRWRFVALVFGYFHWMRREWCYYPTSWCIEKGLHIYTSYVGWAMTLSVRGATLIWHAFQATLTWKYYYSRIRHSTMYVPIVPYQWGIQTTL